MKIDGRKIAEEIFCDLAKKVKKLKEKNIIPHLVIVLVGNDPASKAYIKQKKLKAEAIGVKVSLYHFPTNVSLQKLLLLINKLNHNSSVHGIIVQRPLPLYIDSDKVALAVDQKKDIDAFLPNSKFSVPIACAVLKILEEINILKEIKSKKIVIIGKGETGGKPVIETFKKMSIEPIIIDSKTKEPEKLTKDADIIISAVGKPKIVKPTMIKSGVILISIGLYKGNDGKMHGDYDEEKIKNIASFYTPTPGGVGPVNVACLLKNLISTTEISTQ